MLFFYTFSFFNFISLSAQTQYKQRNIETFFCFNGLKDKPIFKITDDLQKDLNIAVYYSRLTIVRASGTTKTTYLITQFMWWS